MVERHPSTTGLLRWFDYQHLPNDLGVVSMQIHHVAHEVADRLADGPELSAGLRKLLEAKDCFVRQAIADRESNRSVPEQLPPVAVPRLTEPQPPGPQFTEPPYLDLGGPPPLLTPRRAVRDNPQA